jgi:hypothetical protein
MTYGKCILGFKFELKFLSTAFFRDNFWTDNTCIWLITFEVPPGTFRLLHIEYPSHYFVRFEPKYERVSTLWLNSPVLNFINTLSAVLYLFHACWEMKRPLHRVMNSTEHDPSCKYQYMIYNVRASPLHICFSISFDMLNTGISYSLSISESYALHLQCG